LADIAGKGKPLDYSERSLADGSLPKAMPDRYLP